MNEQQIKYFYDVLKQKYNQDGKIMLSDDEKLAKFCAYAPAIDKALEMASLTVDTSNGFDFSEDGNNLVIGLTTENNPRNKVGKIELGYNGISMQYMDRQETTEAYSSISYNGEYTSGTIARVIGPAEIISATLSSDCYLINGEKYPYSANNEEDKLGEISNSLSILANSVGRHL